MCLLVTRLKIERGFIISSVDEILEHQFDGNCIRSIPASAGKLASKSNLLRVAVLPEQYYAMNAGINDDGVPASNHDAPVRPPGRSGPHTLIVRGRLKEGVRSEVGGEQRIICAAGSWKNPD